MRGRERIAHQRCARNRGSIVTTTIDRGRMHARGVGNHRDLVRVGCRHDARQAGAVEAHTADSLRAPLARLVCEVHPVLINAKAIRARAADIGPRRLDARAGDVGPADPMGAIDRATGVRPVDIAAIDRHRLRLLAQTRDEVAVGRRAAGDRCATDPIAPGEVQVPASNSHSSCTTVAAGDECIVTPGAVDADPADVVALQVIDIGGVDKQGERMEADQVRGRATGGRPRHQVIPTAEGIRRAVAGKAPDAARIGVRHQSGAVGERRAFTPVDARELRGARRLHRGAIGHRLRAVRCNDAQPQVGARSRVGRRHEIHQRGASHSRHVRPPGRTIGGCLPLVGVRQVARGGNGIRPRTCCRGDASAWRGRPADRRCDGTDWRQRQWNNLPVRIDRGQQAACRTGAHLHPEALGQVGANRGVHVGRGTGSGSHLPRLAIG